MGDLNRKRYTVDVFTPVDGIENIYHRRPFCASRKTEWEREPTREEQLPYQNRRGTMAAHLELFFFVTTAVCGVGRRHIIYHVYTCSHKNNIDSKRWNMAAWLCRWRCRRAWWFGEAAGISCCAMSVKNAVSTSSMQ